MTDLMQQPLPTQQPSRWNNVVLVVAVVAAIALALGGLSFLGVKMVGPAVTNALGGEPPSILPPTEFTVTGTVTASAAASMLYADDGDECVTSDGYTDIESGAQMEVQNGQGDTIALGTLGVGEMVGYDCSFDFTVTEIPEGEAIYSFRAGNSVRGGMKYTRTQLEEKGEVLALGF